MVAVPASSETSNRPAISRPPHSAIFAASGVSPPLFTGRDVIILEDNDEAGRKKASKAAHALHGTAKTIRIVCLPGLADKGDVSDWFDADTRNAGKFVEVCFEASLWAPETAAGDGGGDHAGDHDGDRDRDHDRDEAAGADTKSETTGCQPLPFINVANWDDEPVPGLEWAVPDRIPLRQVTLFSGEGSAGKSTTQLHLSFAHVLARDWLGTMPEPGPALFVDAEDDEKILHRRSAAILDHYGATFKEAVDGGLHLVSLSGQDAVLGAASRRSGVIQPTPLFKRLLEAAGDIKPKMIGIASSANVYAASEIDRQQVQQFISLLTAVARVANGALVLISHPSLTGINSDTGLSGNTAWHNAVRARFYMKGVKPEAGEQPDNDLREIVGHHRRALPERPLPARARRGLARPRGARNQCRSDLPRTSEPLHAGEPTSVLHAMLHLRTDRLRAGGRGEESRPHQQRFCRCHAALVRHRQNLERKPRQAVEQALSPRVQITNRKTS
jgi:AAA domain